MTVSLDDIVSLCKRRGFMFQGSDIFGGLAGTWDYGPLGVQLKKNLTDVWWKTFVESRDDMVGIDAAILMNPRTWQASGHVDTFTDPMVVCTTCGQSYREDHLDYTKACTKCGSKDTYGQPRQFNLMFETVAGPVTDERNKIYLRPETAQGIFTNYKNVVDTLYPDIPFGIAQIGKAFRNEISPRDFVFRSREFSQMEIEYFVRDDQWPAEFEKWVSAIKGFLESVGVDLDRVKEYEVPADDLAHYSKRTIDFEFAFPHGDDELLGLAYRTSFDLDNVARESGKSMEYRPKDGSPAFVPHVIEPSFGVERLVMAVLCSAYREDEMNGEKRVYLALPENIAPVRFMVSPLLKNKPELVEKARTVYRAMKEKYGVVIWDDNSNVGKRYRRADEIGVPKCITIDFQTLEDNTVTVRDRDSAVQHRMSIDDLTRSPT